MDSKPSITYESWAALNADHKLTKVELKRMSMPWRLWEVVIARMNNYGHAAFRKDELTRLACGKVSRSDVQAVYRGLRILADMGRIAPVGDKGSTLFCVLVNEDIAMRSAGRGNYKYLCSEHSHIDIRQTPYSPATLDPEFMSPPWDDGPDAWDAWDMPADDQASNPDAA
jgi:hypothetical protein